MKLSDQILSELPRYVVVEGPIGVGKTTLVTRLGELLEARTILEIFEENPFLPGFYQDQARYAFQTEMFFLLSRFRQQERFAQEELFSRFTISDYLFVKCRLFAAMTLSEHERALFDRVYSILAKNTPTPDLVIYLHAPVPTLLSRIGRRGREYEKSIEPGYLSRLMEVYTEYFADHHGAPLLTVDTSDVNFHDDAALHALLEEMVLARRHGRRAFAWRPGEGEGEALEIGEGSR